MPRSRIAWIFLQFSFFVLCVFRFLRKVMPPPPPLLLLPPHPPPPTRWPLSSIKLPQWLLCQEVTTWPMGLSWLLNPGNNTLRCCSVYSLKCMWADFCALRSLGTECSFRHPHTVKVLRIARRLHLRIQWVHSVRSQPETRDFQEGSKQEFFPWISWRLLYLQASKNHSNKQTE